MTRRFETNLKTYYIYIIECKNGSYYVGYTLDIKRRYQEHCEGSSKCKYTRAFPPKRLAACWSFESDSVSEALKIELRIKRMTRKQKEALVTNPEAFQSSVDVSIHLFKCLG